MSGDDYEDYGIDDNMNLTEPEPDPPESWEKYEHMGGKERGNVFTNVLAQDAKREAAMLWVDPPPMGTGGRMSTTVAPEVQHVYIDAIQSGIFPWKTQADALRSALFWFMVNKLPRAFRLKYDDQLKNIARVQRVSASAKIMQDVSRLVKGVRSVVAGYVEEGDEAGAVAWLRTQLHDLGRGTYSDKARERIRLALETDEKLMLVWIQATEGPRLAEGGRDGGEDDLSKV